MLVPDNRHACSALAFKQRAYAICTTKHHMA